jgi:hypothetical protein
MWLLRVGDEELGLVGIGTRVGHGKHTTRIELESRPYFVWKGFAPYALATFARTGIVTGLDHEALDVAMKNASIKIIRGTES